MTATPAASQAAAPRPLYDGIHLLRALACFYVVLAHSAEYLFGSFSPRWLAAICYDALSRPSVPIFLMITGFLLLDREEPIDRFYRKRFTRMVVPFLFYCVLYLVIDRVSIHSWLYRIYIGSVAPHFWYIYELIGIYLFMPFLRKIFIHSTTTERLIYAGFWIVWSIFFPTIQKFYGLTNNPIIIYHLDKFTGYVGYVFIGACFKQYTRVSKPAMLALYLLGAGCVVALFYHYSIVPQIFYTLFIENLSPFLFLAACGLFCWLKDARITYCRGLILAISESSYGIYMLHFVFVSSLYRYNLFSGHTGSPWLSIPATAVLVFVVTFAILYVLRRVPVLRRLVT